MIESNVHVKKGTILLFFCYELAYAVRVDRLEKLLERQETAGAVALPRSKSHYLRFETYPLLIKLGSEEVTVGSWKKTAEVQARVFDFGVVSLCFKIPVSGGFGQLTAEADLLSETDAFFQLSKIYLERIKNLVAPSLVRPITSKLVEDYSIFHVSELDPSIDGQELVERHGREIAMILRGEKTRLAEQATRLALSDRVSYYPDDMLVVDWDRAFLYDRESNTDHIDIIEFANTVLLDMRFYDGWLDHELESLYGEIRAMGRRVPVFRVARYRKLGKRIMLIMADVMWLADKIENSLKAIDTLYAARVYRVISERLYLGEWKRGLGSKLATLQSISSTLNLDITNSRLVVLELAIVLLIAVEIILMMIFIGS